MPQSDFGPVNIIQGNSAAFTLEFFDSNGITTTPSSANLTVTYTSIYAGNPIQVDNVTLTLVGSFWNGTWSSTSATTGLAQWVVTATGSAAVAQSGTLRIIDP